MFLLLLKFSRENTIRRYIIIVYFISAFFSILRLFVNPWKYQISFVAIIYFTCCIFLVLYPFIKNGSLDCTNFVYPKKFINILAFLLIFFGLISIAYIIPKLFSIQAAVNNIADVRKAYYDGTVLYDKHQSFFETFATWILFIEFLAPFLCFYFYIHKNKTVAILLAIVSIGPALQGLTIAEREATIIVLSNYLFSLIFWNKLLTKSLKKSIKKITLIFAVPMVGFVILMTLARFAESGIIDSLIVYIGDQPYNFSYIFSYLNMPEQNLGGRYCFGYLFPENERLFGLLNDYISSPIFLNVFAGIPGSFFLDFDYYAIFVIAIISFIFTSLLSGNKTKKSFGTLFIYILYFQIIFVGMFYFDFNNKYVVIMSILLSLCWLLWKSLSYLNFHKKKTLARDVFNVQR